jgi:hypothetical protein
MARRKKPTFNKKTLIGIGIASALIGTYFLAGEKIKKFFVKDDEDQNDQQPVQPVIAPVVPATRDVAPVVQTQTILETEGLNPDKRLKKGSQGEEVKRLQIQFNDVYYDKDTKAGPYKGDYGTFTFPLKTDGKWGDDTEKALKHAYSFYRDKGYLTLDQGRYAYAYTKGYIGSAFPPSLRSSSRYQRYADAFKLGQIDKQKTRK